MSIMKNKPRLGRGLSSLISVGNLPVEADLPASPERLDPAKGPMAILPEAPHASPAPAQAAVPTDGSSLQISVEAIVPNPYQPRKQMNEASVAELAASLRATGLIQPIVVRKVGETYQLIAGERRLRAAKLAGLATIPAILREVDSFTQAQMALVENIQRENLNPIDRAQAYRTLMGQLGLTQVELAGRLGEDRSSIANHLRLLDLAEPVQAMVSDGRISLGHAKILAGVQDILEQQRLATLVVTQGLSVRNLERLLQESATRTAPPAPVPANGSAYHQDLEKSLSRQLGLRVQLRAGAKKGKGKLILHYGTLDQFDELMNRLGVKPE
jgi:ParB family transcriptional regulator, chromosome partitioning protein